jgi:hypothetical protein
MLKALMFAKQLMLEGFIRKSGFPCMGGNEVDEGFRVIG